MLSGKQNPQYKHGHTSGRFSPTYHSWATMHQRCSNKKTTHYRHYGGRGIAVCDRWVSFENFLADMGERPEGTSLDRINNDGPYSPENCRWATRAQQARNSSQTKLIRLGEETRPLVEWCSLLGISINTVRCRVKKHGYTYEDALTKPVQTTVERRALCRKMNEARR